MYAAFLRAINVGGHVVKMDVLRGLFETMGLAQVRTVLASGNILFDTSPADSQILAAMITRGLAQALGYDVAAFVRTAEEVQDIARFRPFPAAEASQPDGSLYIGFLGENLSPDAVQKVLSFRTPVDSFHVRGREVYWLCRIRSSESTFSLARLEKALGVQGTFRNSTTVRKMAEITANSTRSQD